MHVHFPRWFLESELYVFDNFLPIFSDFDQNHARPPGAGGPEKFSRDLQDLGVSSLNSNEYTYFTIRCVLKLHCCVFANHFGTFSR